MQITNCQGLRSRFLFLKSILILGHITFVLFVIVTLFHRDKYGVISDYIFRHVTSFDGKSYMWKTCGKKFFKKCIPCQTVSNMFEVSAPRKEFRDIRRQLLIAKTTTFSKDQHHAQRSVSKYERSIM